MSKQETSLGLTEYKKCRDAIKWTPGDYIQILAENFTLIPVASVCLPCAALRAVLNVYSDISERYNEGIVIRGSPNYRKKVREYLNKLKETETGRQIIDALAEAGKKGKITTIKDGGERENSAMAAGNRWSSYPRRVKIDGIVYELKRDKEGRMKAINQSTGKEIEINEINSENKIEILERGEGVGSIVHFDPCHEPKYEESGKSCRSPDIALGHELIHALHNAQGENLRLFRDPSDKQAGGSNHEEARTIGRGAYQDEKLTDNNLRRERGFNPRTSHASICP
jgi:hypothetical protein